MLPVISIDEPPSSEPRSADVPPGLALLGLTVAPLLGALLMTLGIYLASTFDDSFRWRDVLLSMLIPIAWSVICGQTYLKTIARLRAQITRTDCFLLGCGSGILLPFVIDLTGTLFLRGQVPSLDWTHIKAYAFAGLFTLPFGLFGGWVFWRISVRPGHAPTQDVSGVFE